MTVTHAKFQNVYPNPAVLGVGDHNKHWEYWDSLMQKLDSYFGVGAYSARPASPTQNGARYYATDIIAEYLWTSSPAAWHRISTPAGTLAAFYGTDENAVPEGYVLAYGQSISNAQTLYPEIWGILPASAKSGSTWLVADWRGRAIVGLDNMGGSDANRLGAQPSTTMGANGGSATHALSEAELAAHAHTTPNHNHDIGHTHTLTIGQTGINYAAGASTLNPYNIVGGTQASGAIQFGAHAGVSGNATPTTNPTGSGTGHNNVQPYACANVIIKL